MEARDSDSPIVRHALPEDAAAMAALNRDVQAVHAALMPGLFKAPGPTTMSEQDARELIATPTNVILLALVDAVPIGYLYAEVRRRAESAYMHAYEEIYLHHLSVQPAHQRHGAGTALIDAITAWGENRGVHRVALDVWTANTAAAAFFRRHGFVPYNERLARGGWGTTHRGPST